MERKKLFIIDTDTAGDDAIALLLALRWPGVEVKAITTVAGNVPLALCTRNAKTTVEVANRKDVPVYVGASKPLMRELITCEHIHGENGMGGTYFPEPNVQAGDEHAVLAIIRLINEYPGEIELIAQGPLTNIALAYQLDPSITKKLKKLWLMGGSNNYLGNDSPAAEFNFLVDPEAAYMVVHAGFNLTMVGWDVCHRTKTITEDHLVEIEKIGTDFSKFYLSVLRTEFEFEFSRTGIRRCTHPDTLTVAIAIDDKVMAKSGRYYLDIEHKSDLTRGYSLVDINGVLNKEANAEICIDVHADRFRKMIFSILKQK